MIPIIHQKIFMGYEPNTYRITAKVLSVSEKSADCQFTVTNKLNNTSKVITYSCSIDYFMRDFKHAMSEIYSMLATNSTESEKKRNETNNNFRCD